MTLLARSEPCAAPLLLIVDDDEVSRLGTASVATSLGYAVVEAADGVEALLACATSMPAVALMDLRMPRMDGFEASARLREGQRIGVFAPFPIIACTSRTDPDVLRRCSETGMALVLPKPLSAAALAAALDRADVQQAMEAARDTGQRAPEPAPGPAARLAERLRAAAQAQALAPQPLVLLPQLCSLAHTLRLALDKRIWIDVRVERDCLDARADAAALEAALIELCVNARDAMPDGGQLVFSARNGHLHGGAPAVAIEVGDNGHGMAEPALQRATEPFFTTRTDRLAGLGLAAVQGFALQSGGAIHIRSRVGAGTTVTLLLPAA
jgi:CheY-like chemotaxis protein